MEKERVYVVCIIKNSQVFYSKMFTDYQMAHKLLRERYKDYFSSKISEVISTEYNKYKWTMEIEGEGCYKCEIIYDDIELKSDGN